ncbi:MAG TPA: heat-inducible transcriptional repressor HrcA [Candidatus Dormibacteraeota bacterium]|nr:heat-inducible transcriptional repressor HrcA [Candidatus Dormibacteraeota bacterium]
MDQRKERILRAVVSDYTETIVPVGSHALAARYFLELSSATIRNELSELVDHGFLAQPHASAGRVPTDRGYRYFVDFLLPQEVVEPQLRRQVRRGFEAADHDVEAVLEVAAAMLSRLSENVAVVTGPANSTSRLRHIDLVLVRPGQALMVEIATGNAALQRLVEIDVLVDQEQLSAWAGRLNQMYRGMAAEEVESSPLVPDLAPGAQALGPEIARGLRQLATRSALVIHNGVRNLVRQPEFEDPARLRAVLEVLEAQRILGDVLAQLAPQGGMQVLIGHENSIEELRECSLVLTSYQAGDQMWGTIGVVGPTRIRYGQVAARLQLVSQATGDALTRLMA